MIIINKPSTYITDYVEHGMLKVRCYNCGREMEVHPMTNSNAPWLTDCSLHKKEDSTDE